MVIDMTGDALISASGRLSGAINPNKPESPDSERRPPPTKARNSSDKRGSRPVLAAFERSAYPITIYDSRMRFISVASGSKGLSSNLYARISRPIVRPCYCQQTAVTLEVDTRVLNPDLCFISAERIHIKVHTAVKRLRASKLDGVHALPKRGAVSLQQLAPIAAAQTLPVGTFVAVLEHRLRQIVR